MIRPNGEPVLIEANVGRWHGQDTVTICNMCYGYNAVELTIDSILSNQKNREKLLINVSSQTMQMNLRDQV